jgi:hypothetical protein
MQIPSKTLMILPISTFSKNENEPNLTQFKPNFYRFIVQHSSFNLASPMGPWCRSSTVTLAGWLVFAFPVFHSPASWPYEIVRL